MNFVVVVVVVVVVVTDRFYIALFSTVGQTHCTHVACDSQWGDCSLP